MDKLRAATDAVLARRAGGIAPGLSFELRLLHGERALDSYHGIQLVVVDGIPIASHDLGHSRWGTIAAEWATGGTRRIAVASDEDELVGLMLGQVRIGHVLNRARVTAVQGIWTLTVIDATFGREHRLYAFDNAPPT